MVIPSDHQETWREKMSENHIPFDFCDDSTLANQGVGKTIEKPLKELPWNQQYRLSDNFYDSSSRKAHLVMLIIQKPIT